MGAAGFNAAAPPCLRCPCITPCYSHWYSFTYLMNGLLHAGNWTGLFRPDEAGHARATSRDERFTTGFGLNNLEFGVRLGTKSGGSLLPISVSLDRSFGETATLVREEGGHPSQVRFVAGLMMWF